MMHDEPIIPSSRIEAFSDGVIAIIITIMVFDLKIQEIPDDKNVWKELAGLLPKILSYAASFLMIAIMWVNHHQLFHQIQRTDRNLLWYNLHLLFWMSLIPFAANFIGANPLRWQASFVYGILFALNALAFSFLRTYTVFTGLLHEAINLEQHYKIRTKNKVAISIYLSAAVLSMVSVYISFVLFLVVPAMYFIPEKIIHKQS